MSSTSKEQGGSWQLAQVFPGEQACGNGGNIQTQQKATEVFAIAEDGFQPLADQSGEQELTADMEVLLDRAAATTCRTAALR